MVLRTNTKQVQGIKMNILVTGGLGFIGHNVVKLLKTQGHTIVVVDNATNYGIIPQAEVDYLIAEREFRIAPCLTHRADIKDQGTMEYIIQRHAIDLVVHLASFPRQKVVNINPCWGSQTMSEGLLSLIEASAKHGVKKFVYVSSSMVYGNFTDEYFDGVDENHPTNPIGQYGIMKLAGEWLVKDYSRSKGLTYTIVRPSAVYGPYDVEDRVVSKFLLAAMRGETIQVNGPKESLDFTYVDDVADGIASASVSDNTDNMTYNITRGQSHTLLEAAELAIKIAGSGQIQVNERDDSFPSRGALNTVRAYQDFSFTPTTDIELGFQLYYDWLINTPIYK
jgi:nucleoside-diphosphate-sugar epimerase